MASARPGRSEATPGSGSSSVPTPDHPNGASILLPSYLAEFDPPMAEL